MGVGQQLMAALGLHMLLKVFSFSAGVLLTRSQSSSMRGATFALDLYVNSALFISTAAVRAVNARRGSRTPLDVAEGFAFSLLGLAVFAFVAIPTVGAHAFAAQPAEFLASMSFWPTLGGVAGVVLELLAEPWYGLALAVGAFKLKVLCEGLGVTIRLAATLVAIRTHCFGLSASDEMDLAINAFSVGLFAHGAFVWVFYWRTVRRLAMSTGAAMSADEDGAPLDASKESVCRAYRTGQATLVQPPGPLFSRVRRALLRSSTLFRELFSESLLRLVLTEGEKAVLATKGNLASQGVYDVISSLGALVVRVVFRLWEDFTFAAWSRPDDSNAASTADDAAIAKMATASSPTTKHAPASTSFDAAAHAVVGARASPVSAPKWDLLFSMLRLACHFGALAVTFGPPLAPRLLWTLFGGARTADFTSQAAVDVLVAYVHYIPLLGLNGLLEAFVRATSAEKELKTVKMAMIACSLCYVGLCAVTLFVLDAGATGLIMANCANLAVRIVVSAWIIENGVAVASGRAATSSSEGRWWLPQCAPGPSALAVHATAYLTVRVVPPFMSGTGFGHHHPDSTHGMIADLEAVQVDAFVVLVAVVTMLLVVATDDACRPVLDRLRAKLLRR